MSGDNVSFDDLAREAAEREHGQDAIADITPLVERLKRNDEGDVELRRASSNIDTLIGQLPVTDDLLVEESALAAWRILRERHPRLYRIYLGKIRSLWAHRGLADMVEALVGPPGSAGAATGPLHGYAAASIWDGYEPPRYLVKRMLSPGGLTVLFGQSGHLKSVTAIDLSLSIATGTPFHGLRTRRAGVLYVAGEGHAGIKKRAKAWMLAHGIGPADEQPALYITSTGADLITNPEQLRATAEHAAEVLGVNIELVVIDTLAANFGAGDENKASDMTLAIAGARMAHAEAAVLIVHHTGHGQSERERGSYALIAAADFRLQATYDEPARFLELKWLKVKDDEIPEPMIFERRKIALEWTDEDGEELTSVVLERLEGVSTGPTAPRPVGLGKNQEIALKVLTTIYARVRRNVELDGRDPAEALVLTDGWRRELEKKKIDRNRWQEILTGLQARGLIVIEGPHVRLIQGGA